jgi:hypothetical protein
MGRDDSKDRRQGNFTGVTKINDELLAKLMAYGLEVIEEENGSIYDAFKKESSTDAKLDYKNKIYDVLNIPKQNLLEINGILYNPNEAGNYVWGMLYEYADEATNYSGATLNPAFAADIKTMISQGRADEVHEQRAIQAGSTNGDKQSENKEFNKKVSGQLSTKVLQHFTAKRF